MSRLIVHRQTIPLRGSVPVPSDKSIGHRAVIFGALSSGRCKIAGFSYGEDNVATLAGFRAMGVGVDDDSRGTVIVQGVGLDGLRPASEPFDCGNSGTTMRLVAGVLAAQPFASRLVGDNSLSRRPMGRIARPLRARGAVIEGSPHPRVASEITPPLDIGPLPEGRRLSGLEYHSPVASAQVKSCLLLSGLFASGPTVLSEPLLSRDHTERALMALGIPIEATGTLVTMQPPSDAKAIGEFDVELPGDVSAAAFVVVAASLVDGSLVTVRRTGLNPTRTGILDVLRAFGGSSTIEPQGQTLGEPFGAVTVGHGELRGTSVGGELAVRAIDEIPIACALAARARGVSRFDDVAELRVKESDRIAQMVQVLRSFGLEAEEHDAGLSVEGRPEGPLKAAQVESHGDHRIAMTAAVLGLVADGETVIDDVDCIRTSFPRFVGTLRALGATVEVSP